MSRHFWKSVGLVLFAGTLWTMTGPAQGQNSKRPKADKPLRSAAVSPDGRLLATTGPDGAVPVWDAATGRLLEMGLSPTPSLQEALVGRLIDQDDNTFGATLQPVTPVQRAQLNIPAGQGLVITSIRADGPSAQAGLKRNDILLSVADEPIANLASLTRELKGVGERPVSLKLLRDGKQISLEVRPIYHVTLGPVHQTEYYIGVSISPVDEVLRDQVGMSGVVVTEVVKGSPAEKAGIQKYDSIARVEGKPVDSAQTLTRLVQASKGKPLDLMIVRHRHVRRMQLTPAARQMDTSRDLSAAHLLLREVALSQLAQLARSSLAAQAPPAANGTLERRLDRLDKELRALREELAGLRASLKSGKPTKSN